MYTRQIMYEIWNKIQLIQICGIFIQISEGTFLVGQCFFGKLQHGVCVETVDF